MEYEFPMTYFSQFKPSPFPALLALRETTATQNDVALSLATRVISTTKAKDKNFVFSPLSIHVLLGLIAAGSASPTRDQILGYFKSGSSHKLKSLTSHLVNVLLADGGPLGGPCLSSAKGAWIGEGLTLKPSFQQVVESDYKAACKLVDFKNKAYVVGEEVNAWVEQETNGLIKDLIPSGSVGSNTKLILANALYFKGDWTEEFDKDLTKNHKFFLLNGSSVEVPFMKSYNRRYIRAFDDFKVLRLMYKQGEDGRQFSMCLFLPNAKDGLPSLVEKVGSNSGFIENHLPRRQVKVGDVRIPKFKISYDFEASEVLKGQGLVLPFEMGGLTEMVDDSAVGRLLQVSKIFHKSFIEVNEEGTEAAAASACEQVEGCSRFAVKRKTSLIDFVADHPFMFVVREDVSGVVIFAGQVLIPLAS